MNTFPMIVSGLTAATAVGAALVDHGVYWRSSKLLDRSVYRGAEDRQSVALTFDDGPTPQTLDLLEYLEREDIRATFFQCGMNAERYPGITQQVHALGHEIGNHTWSHPRLSPEFKRGLRIPSPRTMYRELASTQKLLTELCKETPQLFRAPFGQRWVGLDVVRQRLRLIGVQWTVIGHDWEWSGERVAEYVIPRTTPGGIVCLHDGRDVQPHPDVSATLTALKSIVPALRDKGYRFETVSSLLVPTPVSVSIPAL